MHLKNNYNKQVFNGDTGCTKYCARGRRKDRIDSPGADPGIWWNIPRKALEDLLWLTVLPCPGRKCHYHYAFTAHYIMLARNLLYTGITGQERWY